MVGREKKEGGEWGGGKGVVGMEKGVPVVNLCLSSIKFEGLVLIHANCHSVSDDNNFVFK